MKYGNKKTVIDGITFDSKREAKRYSELKLLLHAGEISMLSRQVAFVLAPSVKINGRNRPPLKYIADFTYTDRNGQMVIEDCKGFVTEGYRIKRHFMAAAGYSILET